MYSFSRNQEKENMAHLVEAYARTITRLTHDAELYYAYAKQDGQSDAQHVQELKQHMAGLTLIITAALSELAKVTHITPVVLETLSALTPKEAFKSSKSSLSQSDLLSTLAERIGRFQTLLNEVEPNPSKIPTLQMSIKLEMDICNNLMSQLKATPEWEHVKGLASVKLLSDVLERGVELSAKEGSKPRGQSKL